jgi:hypothetical protein
MAIIRSLTDVALERGDSNGVVDDLTENNPMLSLSATPSNKGISNILEEVEERTGARIVDANEGAPAMSEKRKTVPIDLSFIKGEEEVTEDTLDMMEIDAGAYFEPRISGYINDTGRNISKILNYNRIQPAAIALGNYDTVEKSPSGDNYYSMTFVRHMPYQTSILYNQYIQNASEIVKVIEINNGESYKRVSDGNHVFGLRLKGHLGFQIAGTQTVASLFNIDENNIPTVKDIDKMLRYIRKDKQGQKAVFMADHVKDMLGETLVFAKQQFTNMATGISFELDTYKGVPFIVDQNFLDGTEPAQNNPS